jgi:Flp pilus assembly protein TadD
MAMNNYAGVLTQIALAEAVQGNHDDAMLAMDNAAEVAPGSSAIAMGRGYLLERKGDWALAAQYYQDLRTRYPRDWRVPSREGLSWLQAGQVPQAEAALQHAIDLSPRTFDPYQQLLSVYYSQDDVPGALRVMQAWLQVVPDDPRIRPLFEELSRTGRFPRSEEDTTSGR